MLHIHAKLVLDRAGHPVDIGLGEHVTAAETPPNWVHVALVMSTALCIGLTLGLFPALLALKVDALGYTTSSNGMLAAMHGLAGFLVSPLVPKLVNALGALRTYIASTIIAALMIVLFIVFYSLGAWFVLRFLLGLALGAQWIVSETWMNQLAIGARRGTIISLYVVVLSIGLAIGPLIMAGVGTEGAEPFLIAAFMLSLSFVPLLFLPRWQATGGEGKHTLPLLAAMLRKPSAMFAGAVDGLIYQVLMALLPLYFLHLGTSEALAIGMLNALFVGGIAFQVVVGYLIDRYTPEKVLVFASLIVIICLGLIAVRGLNGTALWTIMFVMGGPAAAIYTAGLASVNDAFSAEDMPSGTAAYTMIWHLGGLSGPALAGMAMDLWDPYGLSLVVGIALAVLVVANLSAFAKSAAKTL